MSTFGLTTLIATIVVVLCALFIGIGKLITGKDKFSCKRCGKPEEKEKSGCGLCKNQKKSPPK